jgi:inner membrane protein
VAANAPDVDVLSYLHGEYFALAFRRGITHGVPALALLPFAVAGAVLAWDRCVRLRRNPGAARARPLPILGLALLGLATHPLLDWTNNYGMRLWLPFDGRWSYGDSLFIIDPWLWLALGSAVYLSRAWSRSAHASWGALAAAASLVMLGTSLPLGAKAAWTAWLVVLVALGARGTPPSADAGRRRALGLSAVAVVYVSAMVLAAGAASRSTQEAAQREGLASIDALMVAPVPADPFASVVLIRAGDRLFRGTYRWTRRPRLLLGTAGSAPVRAGGPGLTPAELEHAIAAAAEQPDVIHFLSWARFPYYRVTDEGGEGYRVRISDARYDARGGSLAGVELRVPRTAVRP